MLSSALVTHSATRDAILSSANVIYKSEIHLFYMVVKYKMSNEDEPECFVCFEPVGEKTGVVNLKCGHTYCPPCFAQHMRRDNLCGVCREEVTEENPKHLRAEVRRDIEREIREEEEEYEEVRGPPLLNNDLVYLGLMNTFMTPQPPLITPPSWLLNVPQPISIQNIIRDFIDTLPPTGGPPTGGPPSGGVGEID